MVAAARAALHLDPAHRVVDKGPGDICVRVRELVLPEALDRRIHGIDFHHDIAEMHQHLLLVPNRIAPAPLT